jgi:hypothetical protein
MKKSKTIDFVDLIRDLLQTGTQFVRSLFFHVRPETFGLKSGLSHNGTCTPRRLLCAPHLRSPSPHLRRPST